MQPPTTIGRYQIVAELGRGGMATVYRAFDPLVKRDVAIKLLPREFLHNPSFRSRFEQEARAVATLEHPAIVPIYDFGEEDGQPFIVMRLLTGGSLADRIRESPLPLAEAARIVSGLAPGLDHAHTMGIIHRDLKPANILFDGFNNPHLSDFGLAKLIGSAHLAEDSGMFGTPDYMAPEMAQKGRIGKLIDIYALGVTIFEMLTGRPPYAADTPVGLLMLHASEPVPDLRDSLPDLPENVQEVIHRAMAKDPDDRYHTASDLAADLEAITASGKTQKLALLRRDLTPQLSEADFKRLRQRPRLPRAILAVGAGVALLGVVAVIAFRGGLPAAPATSTPPDGIETAPPTTTDIAPTPSEDVTTGEPTPEVTLPPTPNARAITLDTIRLVQPIRRLSGHTSLVNTVTWSPDGTLASASADKIVILWNAAAGEAIATLAGHGNWVQGLAFSPDGKLLASTSSDHTAIIWDTVTHQPTRTIKTELYGLNGVDWSPDGQRLALSPFFTNPLLYSVQTGQMIRELKGHTYQVNAVAFSPDGATLASGAKDARIILWDSITGDQVRSLDGHSRTVFSLAWSPLGRELASGSGDQRLIVWNTDTGEIRLKLSGHRDQVNSIAWSPDGSVIATGSSDATIRLWNAQTGDLLRVLDASAGPVSSIDWSPDGALIASAQYNGSVILWGIAP